MYKTPIGPPSTWMEPMMMPLILTFFGVLVFGLGLRQELAGSKAPWKWLGIFLCAAAFLVGSRYTYWYFGPDKAFYAEGNYIMQGRGMRLSHIFASALPMLSILGGLILMPITKGIAARRNEEYLDQPAATGAESAPIVEEPIYAEDDEFIEDEEYMDDELLEDDEEFYEEDEAAQDVAPPGDVR